MNFAASVRSCFENYVTFSGRAPRSEYWYWLLFNMIAGWIVGFIEGFYLAFNGLEPDSFIPVGSIILSLALLLPGLTVSVRRLHDIDRSGWWYFMWMLPIIGWILMIYWMVKKGTEGSNRFGNDPLLVIG